MNNILTDLRSFLIKNKKLIDNNEYETLYLYALRSDSNVEINFLTALLFKAGINPIPYFDHYIPSGFAESVTIPKRIVITKNINGIGERAFSNQPRPLLIFFTKPEVLLYSNCFSSCKALTITYPGTKDDFNKMLLNSGYDDFDIFNNSTVRLQCTDKTETYRY